MQFIVLVFTTHLCDFQGPISLVFQIWRALSLSAASRNAVRNFEYLLVALVVRRLSLLPALFWCA